MESLHSTNNEFNRILMILSCCQKQLHMYVHLYVRTYALSLYCYTAPIRHIIYCSMVPYAKCVLIQFSYIPHNTIFCILLDTLQQTQLSYRWHTAACFLVPDQQLHFQHDYHFTRHDDTPMYVVIIQLIHTTYVLQKYLLTQTHLPDSQKV